MTGPPDFEGLVGDGGTPEELARLRRVHELLVAAGPPPEVSDRKPPEVKGAVVRLQPRRRLLAALAFAAALVVAAFAVGYLVGGRGQELDAIAVRAMHGVPPVADAHADLRIGEEDEQGNVPIEMIVRGLRTLPERGYYELYLSKAGKPVVSCGTFRADESKTTVRLSVAYELQPWGKRFDGWVVTAHVPGRPKSADRVLLTT